MASEILSLLLWASATLSVGIMIVLALRVPVRRVAGARVAYLLWLIPPLGFLAWLAPARQEIVTLPATLTDAANVGTAVAFAWPANALVACWLIGLAGMIAVFGFRQRRFSAAAGLLEPVAALGRDVFAAAPTHGPAVVGALRPVIVLPSDFGSRFSADEQALILAHERAHVERGDPLVNAAALAARAVHWFNPLVHVAVRALRIDQELACDATVVERHGGARRTYAEAMLKSHAAAVDVPIGCAWHSSAFHPMKERILMLKASPSRLGRRLGLSFVACAALGVGGAVWLMRPVEVLAAPAKELAEADVDALDALDSLDSLDEIEAVDALNGVDAEDIAEARTRAQQAQIEAWQAAREARAAVASARAAAAVEARQAIRDARAAVAEARRAAAVEVKLAMAQVKPAIAAAREAAKSARPAIAEAQRALEVARPAIAAAMREARASGAMAAQAEAKAKAWAKAQARLARACRRALVRSSEDLTADQELRVLRTLVCIPHGRGAAAPAAD